MIFTIAGKELRSLFASPLAWLVLTVVQIILGYGFLKRLDDFLQIQSQLAQLASPPGVTELVAAPTFATAAAVLLFAVPLLAMRMIAEERRNQTLTLLLSAPVSITEIVLGKFVGLVAFLLIIVLLVAAMPLTLAGSTRPGFQPARDTDARPAAACSQLRRGQPLCVQHRRLNRSRLH